MTTHNQMTEASKQLLIAILDDTLEASGICLECEATVPNVNPNAEQQYCKTCGKYAVCGYDIASFMFG